MAHLFKQTYCDEVDFEKLPMDKLINLVFTEFLLVKMRHVEEHEICEQLTDHDSGTGYCRKRTDEDEDLWILYANKAICRIDRPNIWRAFRHACKILKYPNLLSQKRSI